MLYGVEQKKLELDDIFYVLDFVFNNLTVQQAENFWQAIESRGYAMAADLPPNGNPGIFLVNILKTLTERLDPYVDTDFRAKVEQFYLKAFGPGTADPAAPSDKVPLLITQEESDSRDFEVLLAVEKSLASIKQIAETPASLIEFLDNVAALDDIFARQTLSKRRMFRGTFHELVLSPKVVGYQTRDRSFQYKISIQILLFIEALLMLRPAEIEAYNASKKSKLIWGKLVLDEELISRVNSAKRTWFARVKSHATPDQLEALRLTITREKEALAFMLLKDKPEVVRGEEVNLDAEYAPKLRSKHFHDMGNQKLSSLWSQSLGPEAFSANNDKDALAATSVYQRSKTDPTQESCLGDRWVALFIQRQTDWPALEKGDPPAIGPVFNEPATPKSPSDDTNDGASQSPAPKDTSPAHMGDDRDKLDTKVGSPRASIDGDVKSSLNDGHDGRSEEEPSPKRPRIGRSPPHRTP